jgi:hypothetical protein
MPRAPLLLRSLKDAGTPVVCALTAVLVAGSVVPAATATTLALLVGRLGGGGAAGGVLLPLGAFACVLLAGHAAQAAAGPLESWPGHGSAVRTGRRRVGARADGERCQGRASA